MSSRRGPRQQLLLAALLLTHISAARAQQPFTVGNITVAPGEMRSGFLEVPAAADSATRIPVTVVNGSQSGPVLALIAGTHGSEIAPVVALQRVRARIAPQELRGTLVMVHVANLPSYLKRTIYYSPIDGKNLNRVYPGDPHGTTSQRIAYVITRDVIDKADYLVDMHAGDGNESLRPYTYWNRLRLDARVDSLSRELALAWGNDHIVVDTTRPRDPRASVYTQNTAQTRGKPAITTENGFLGMADEDMIERNVAGALRLLRYLRMLRGPIEMVQHAVWLTQTQVLASPQTGSWYPLVDRGHSVAQGTLIGYATDFFGENRREVRAPFAGVVLYVVATPATSQGEPVGMIGVPSSSWR
ncbi:MAG: M14 family metallopeptidase [Gemmatimonadota bacterium]